jgi:hypothetical protein
VAVKRSKASPGVPPWVKAFLGIGVAILLFGIVTWLSGHDSGQHWQ